MPRATELWGTILVAGLNNAPLAAARLILPLIALGMNLSVSLIGVIAALFSLGPMLLNVPFGRWVDRVGTLVPIVFSTGILLLACVLFEVFHSPAVLFVFAAMVGACAMFSHMVATRAVGDISTGDARARNIGRLIISYALFQFIGPMVAALVYERLGTSAAIAAIGGFGLLSGLVLASGAHGFVPARDRGSRSGTRGRTVELLKIAELMRWLVIIGIFGGVNTIFPLIASLHAIEVGLSAGQAGILLGGFAAGSLTSRITVGWVMRVMPATVIVSVALVCGGLAYAILPLLHALWPLVGLSSVLGFLLGLGAPISLVLVYEAAPPHRINESIGLGTAMTNFQQAFLPLAAGVVASGLGVKAMVWVLALAMLLAASAVIFSMGKSR